MPASVLKVDCRGDIYRIPCDPTLGFAAAVAGVCSLVPPARVGLLTFFGSDASLCLLTEASFPEFLTTAKVGSGGHSILRLQLQLPGAIAPQELAVSQSKLSPQSNGPHPSQEGSGVPKRPSGAVRRARAREKKAAHVTSSSNWEEDTRDIDELLVALDSTPLPVGEVKASSKQLNGYKKGHATRVKQVGSNACVHAEAYPAAQPQDAGPAWTANASEEQYHVHELQEGHEPEKTWNEHNVVHREDEEKFEHEQDYHEQHGDERHITGIGKRTGDMGGARFAAAAKKIASIDMSELMKYSGAEQEASKVCQASDCGTESTHEDMSLVQEDLEDDMDRDGMVHHAESELPAEPHMLWPATPESSPPSSPRFFHSQLSPVFWVPVPVWVPAVQ